MKAKDIARKLATQTYCVCPGFLSPRRLEQLIEDLEGLDRLGKFRPALTGAHQPTGARNDRTLWLEPASATPVQRSLWRKIGLLSTALNRELFLGIKEFEGHYAIYPEGGKYERHSDQIRESKARVVSFVLYLNRTWLPEHGGKLRIYDQQTCVDIDPIGGTLVCFLSETEHEVLESHHTRYSLAGWFRR